MSTLSLDDFDNSPPHPGGRPCSSERLWTEHCRAADAKDLARQIRALGGFQDLQLAGCGCVAAPTTDIAWQEGDQFRRQTVKLLTTRPNYGGIRYWYACPACGARVRKLYLPRGADTVACRRCLRLVYWSQYRKDFRSTLFRWIFRCLER